MLAATFDSQMMWGDAGDVFGCLVGDIYVYIYIYIYINLSANLRAVMTLHFVATSYKVRMMKWRRDRQTETVLSKQIS